MAHAEGRHKDEEKRHRQGEEAKRDRVKEPPGEEKQRRDGKAQQGLHFARADGHPAMGLHEHFNNRNKVEEEGQAAQVHTGLAPPLCRVKHGGEHGYACRRIQNSRHSKPEEMHTDLHLQTLKAYLSVYCDANHLKRSDEPANLTQSTEPAEHYLSELRAADVLLACDS